MYIHWDWVSDINIKELVDFHKSHWKTSTLTAVQPEWRFGKLWLNWNQIIEFAEKKDNEESYINWGYMILNKQIVSEIKWDMVSFENEPLENLSKNWELMCYKHHWFWQAMDTLKNKEDLEKIWNLWNAPWKTW